MPRELTQALIEEYIKHSFGTFNVRDLWAFFSLITPEGKAHLRVILSRLEMSGLIVKTLKDGTYRKVDNDLKPIDWKSADPSKSLPVYFPFEIHKYAKLYPKSIVIVTGDKNSGKTAFLTSCIMPNTNYFTVDLFNSETGPEQLNERFAPLDIPEVPPFNTYERYDNFSDAIHPEHLSVIDYLDFNSEVYLVGAEIDAIFRKLTTGVAVIGIQKPPATRTYVKGVEKIIERDLAYGAGMSAKRAALYISLTHTGASTGRLKLLYVKTPRNPRIKPDNMMWTYSFDDYGYFTNIERYYPKNQFQEPFKENDF